MATTPIDTWAVDLANVTKIYPWDGGEVIMAWVGIVLWIAWHFWQCRHESATYEEERRKHVNPEAIEKAISGD